MSRPASLTPLARVPIGNITSVNFSTWNRDDGEADDAAEAILDGTMPPDRYTMVHRGARLSDGEADRLVAALQAMDADEGEDDSSGRGGEDD